MENKLKKEEERSGKRGGDKPAHNVLNMLSYSFCYVIITELNFWIGYPLSRSVN